MAETHPQRFWRLLWRSCRLRCPMCGAGKLFSGWFAMNQDCTGCGEKFEREGGFFLGSIYFNYGLTGLITAIVYPTCLFNRVLDATTLMIGSLAFAILFPMWFFRYARALWLGFDHYVDPRSTDEKN